MPNIVPISPVIKSALLQANFHIMELTTFNKAVFASQLQRILRENFSAELADSYEESDWLQAAITNETTPLIFIVDRNVDILGFCSFSDGDIDILVTDEKHRGLGVGNILLAISMSYANHLFDSGEKTTFWTEITPQAISFFQSPVLLCDPQAVFSLTLTFPSDNALEYQLPFSEECINERINQFILKHPPKLKLQEYKTLPFFGRPDLNHECFDATDFSKEEALRKAEEHYQTTLLWNNKSFR